MIRWFNVPLLAPALLAGSLHGLAPTPSIAAESNLDAERAETYARIGMRLADRERFADALTEFRRAEALIQYIAAPGVLYGNIGYCLDRLGHPLDALAAFDEGVRRARSDTIRSRLVGHVDRLRGRFFARLAVTCDAPDVQVQLTGLQARACPAAWERLPPGRYRLEGRAPTALSTTIEVEVAAGDDRALSLELPAGLRLASAVPGQVTIDGEPAGTTPFETDQLPPGEHMITLSTDDGVEWKTRVLARPGEWLDPTVDLSTTQPAPSTDDEIWLWTGVGVAVAATLGVSTYLLLSTPEPTPSAFATE